MIESDFEWVPQGLEELLRRILNYDNWLLPYSVFKSFIQLPSPAKLKASYLRDVIRIGEFSKFIETGTRTGEMVLALSTDVKEIVSIELNKINHFGSKQRLSNIKNVDLILGDSGEMLSTVLADNDEPVVIWLDAHSIHGEQIGYLRTPIYRELRAILDHCHPKSVVLVDDVRLFVGRNDYPEIEEVIDTLREGFPGWEFIQKDDILFCGLTEYLPGNKVAN